MKARNVASFSLRQVKRVLGTESKAEERELKRALDVLTYLGLLEAADGKKPRYVLRRGSPLWTALELGCVDLVTILVDGRRRVAT
jgi:hypothetical protein